MILLLLSRRWEQLFALDHQTSRSLSTYLAKQATRAASPISPLVPNVVLVTSASPSCQKEPRLWESLFPLRLMNLCPLLNLLKELL